MLDNVDDPKVDYERYSPRGPSGVVVLTLRTVECRQHSTQHLALDNLSKAEAQELLLTAAHIPDDQHHKMERRHDSRHLASVTPSCHYLSRSVRIAGSLHLGRISSRQSATAPTTTDAPTEAGTIPLWRRLHDF